LNSFETLGLLPSFIEGLNENQTLTIARYMAKALQFIYHPDKRPDAYLKSIAINEAIRTIESSLYNLQKERMEYIENGPGQCETRAMKEQLEILIQNTALLKVKIDESREKSSETRDLIDVESINNWMASFYMKNILPVPAFSDHESGLGYQFGSILGTKIKVTDFDKHNQYDDLEMKLNELITEYGQGDDEFGESWEDALRDAKRDVETARKELKRGRVTKENLEIEKKRFRLIKEKKEKLEREIKSIKKKLLDLEPEINFVVEIDKDGYIKGPKITKKIQLLGSADISVLEKIETEEGGILPREALLGLIAKPELNPYIEIGAFLYGLDENGRLEEIGVVREIKGARADKKEKGHVVQSLRKKEEKKAEGHETTVALVKKKDIDVSYKKNPFEVIGLLPTLVATLNEEELRTVVKMLATGLNKALHPDVTKQSSLKIAEINAALSALEDQELFARAKKEYSSYKAGEPQRNAIKNEIEKEKEKIAQLANELAEAKAMEEQVKVYGERKRSKAYVVLNAFLDDMYGTKDSPKENKEGRYLHHADGFEIIISNEGKMERYKIKNEGFDVWAVSKNSRLRILGSVEIKEYGDFESAKRQIEKLTMAGCMTDIFPVLSKNNFIVFEADGKFVLGGKIVGLNERQISDDKKQDVKKIAREISNKIKIKDREAMVSKPKIGSRKI